METPFHKIHIPVTVWLQTIALSQYQPYFAQFSGAQDIFDINDSQVLQLGIQNAEHRSRIVSSLQLLAAKCRGTGNTHAQTASSHESKLTPEQELKIKNELTSELMLPSSDMRSLPWFHGKISREAAEQLVSSSHGDFIVRESLSQQGSFVLTCNHNIQPLHFVINKFVETSGGGRYTNTEYGFESSRYSSIQALIMAHITEGALITTASQAVITNPVNRKAPIGQGEEHSRKSFGLMKSSSSDYEVTSPSWQQNKRQLFYQPSPTNKSLDRSSITSPGFYRDQSMERVGSSPQLHSAAGKGRSSPSNMSPRSNIVSAGSLAVPESGLAGKAKSEGELRTTPSQLPHRSAELKTSRNTSAVRQQPVVAIRNQNLYDDGADYSDYYEVRRMPGEANSSQNRTNHSYRTQSNNQSAPSSKSSSLENLLNKQQSGEIGGEDYDTPAPIAVEIHDYTTPIIPKNYLDVHNFHTDLLSEQNRALDPNCMYKMKEALFQVNHQTLSQHITYLDLHLLKVIETRNLGAGIFSGIEALTLPQGQHFRQAAIERHCSLSFVVSVTVLACTDDLLERSQMLKQWIMIAKELLRTQGNLFSFGAIMHGLCSSSISRLKQTWNIFERSDPVLSNQWKTKLQPNYRDLSTASSSLIVDHISVPYVTPVCELYELQEDMMSNSDVSLVGNDDLDSMFSHLDLARLMASQTAEYSRRGQEILRYFSPRPNLKDLFKVELHMRLLYGHNGALAKRSERKIKFEQVLTILSQRAESDDINS